MKYILSVFLLFILVLNLQGQTQAESKEGTISFMTSQNIYVKFQSTATILAGDTLFIVQDAKMIPVLVVKDLSSISCVCTPISAKQLSVADKIISRPKIVQSKKPAEGSGARLSELMPTWQKAPTPEFRNRTDKIIMVFMAQELIRNNFLKSSFMKNIIYYCYEIIY